MRAAVMRDRKLVVADVPVPEPGPGEVLVRTLACGICGSDLHALKYAEQFVETSRRAGNAFVMDLGRDVVMGHEFCAEIVEHGPGTSRALPAGSRVCSRPVLMRATGPQTIGYSNNHPGGYGEFMRLTESLLLPVPAGLSTEHAALTEPLAVGLHAVNKARLEPDDAPLVIGCGPVGLAVIAALRLRDVRPIVAADFSRRRRELAAALGADVVVDPAAASPWQSWREAAVWRDPERAPALPPWLSGPAVRPAVVFECVGVPAMLDQIMAAVPRGTRIVVVGVCMEADTIHPMFGIGKELNLQFALGYTQDEFAATLGHIAAGAIPVAPLITGAVGIEGVAGAFEALASPEQHAKSPRPAVPVSRRSLLRGAAAACLPVVGSSCAPSERPTMAVAPVRRARASDPSWPDRASWERLNGQLDGQLIEVRSPLTVCAAAPRSAECAEIFRRLRNPYYLGDEVGLTQTLGWADAWTSRPSAYAVPARTARDVAAAVTFAREHNVRLVVKGGGHSYLGTSNAPDSLLVWTRRMNAITVHDAFVPAGCAGRVEPQPAVTVGAGAIWMHVYDAVTTRAGRYVQGGGCATVGVAGLIQSGGFGSFSKRYGLAAAGLLEAEIVTADGAVRTANACENPDLFWAIKGGGGGSFGVVTRLTLRTRELPEFFGAAFMTITATSDAAFRRLIGEFVGFYAERLFNPHWGEQVVFRPDSSLTVRMVFQGLNARQAESAWRPWLDRITASPRDFTITSPFQVVAAPARKLWDPAFLRMAPGLVVADDRPGAPEGNVLWAGDAGQVGQFLHAYQSLWLPAELLQGERKGRLADALFAATRHWGVALHVNKGLAGAPVEEVAAARDTAMNPAVLDAFALAISASEGPPAYPGIPGHEPDLPAARQRAAAVSRAMDEMRALRPDAASYVSESDFFQADWARAYWGPNYPRLLTAKDSYDPDGLFIVHHGVGSERWSPDGFTRLTRSQP